MTLDQRGDLVFSDETILHRRRHDDEKFAFPLRKSEWRRLRKRAEQIRPGVAWWAIFGSLFAGGALACATNWIIALSAKTLDRGVILVNFIIALSMIALALVCFIADTTQRKRTTEDARELLLEMDTIERGHPDTFPTVRAQNP